MYEQERSAGLDAVRRACEVCVDVRGKLAGDGVLDKSDRSPVTIADFASQAVVCRALAEAFPDDPIVAEEGSAALRQPENAGLLDRVADHVAAVSGHAADAAAALEAIDRGNLPFTTDRFWTLDPIDGTKGFLRNDQYAVALALIEKGRVVVGILGCPNLPVNAARGEGDVGCLFHAAGEQGAFMVPLDGGAERRIEVARTPECSDAVFCEPFESGHSAHEVSAAVAARLGIVKPPVRMDSQCKYAAVARGDASIYMRLPTRADYEEKIWDHAAGSIVISEAGGRVTDSAGRPLDFTRGRTLSENKGILATNGALHAEVLSALAKK